MTTTLTRSLLALGTAAALLTSPGFSTDVEAKVKDQRFHFVNDSFYEPIVMQMKYKNGQWQWINSNKNFKKRVKLLAVSSKKFSNGSIRLAAAGTNYFNIGIWQQDLGYKTKKIEVLHTFTVNKSLLGSSAKAAATKCNALGGTKRITTGLTLPAHFHISENGRTGVKGGLHINVVCEARKKPAQPKIAKINFYTQPAKPACGKTFNLVADFLGTHPGKYNFSIMRSDGKAYKTSVNLNYAKPLAIGKFVKPLKFNKSTKRRFQIVMGNQAMTSKWIEFDVKCGVNKDHKKAGGLKS